MFRGEVSFRLSRLDKRHNIRILRSCSPHTTLCAFTKIFFFLHFFIFHRIALVGVMQLPFHIWGISSTNFERSIDYIKFQHQRTSQYSRIVLLNIGDRVPNRKVMTEVFLPLGHLILLKSHQSISSSEAT